jgi:hypothetical protein
MIASIPWLHSALNFFLNGILICYSCSQSTSTMCPLWYLCRPSLLSSILTVLLGPPIFSKQPSTYSNMACQQNWPKSVIVPELKQLSSWKVQTCMDARCHMWGTKPHAPTPKLDDQGIPLCLGITFDLPSMGGPMSSYATAGKDVHIIWPRKPHHSNKFEISNVFIWVVPRHL